MPAMPATRSRSAAHSRSLKGEETRRRILETALELFRERGYEEATMRRIAARAGVSLGSAYYYFRSKEHLIQAYYGRSHVEHLNACAELLEREKKLEPRLLGVMRAKLDTSMPYHRFAGQLFKTAADPASPLSPFSAESMPVRSEATELMALVVDGSDTQIAGELGRELPNLLWLYMMGIVLYWIHDDSPGCERTYRLVARTCRIVVRLIQLARLPVLRPLVRETLKLQAELRLGGADRRPTRR